MSVRVRFAPSPTGYLHVGGLRTALYNYLFAKKFNGTLILRIEDTDRSRLVENAMDNLIDSLEWAGINFDESPVKDAAHGPYIQSERLEIYKKYADLLIESGKAYYAFDTPEEIDNMRKRLQESNADSKYDRMNMSNQLTLGEDKTKEFLSQDKQFVIRLKIPDELIEFNDIIRGKVAVHGKEIDDQVLLKSDGFPTYHLANVVDDHLMEITHVIRGEEWLPSTPKHVILYNCFGWEIPQFAHLPLLLNKDKSKLSKRQGDVAVEDYRAKGYFRDAFINFIALLGWNPSADKEIYTIDELIQSFNLEKVNKSGAVFDLVKLDWMNAHYLRNIESVDILAGQLNEILINNNIEASNFSREYLEKVMLLFRERVTFIHEIPSIASYMFKDPDQFDEEYKLKYWKENTGELLAELKTDLVNLNNFDHLTVHDEVMKFVESKGIKLKEIIHPIRLIITGRSQGAGMFETMEVLGKEVCLKRFEYFLSKVN
jgi:glutamyl-tRNA synthetase